eukprot:1276311-Amphidinium_carterae.1
MELGGRTLHVFNLYGYDESYEDHGERNRALCCRRCFPMSLRSETTLLSSEEIGISSLLSFQLTWPGGIYTLVRPPSDNLPTSPYGGRKIDWFLISPHMRDSVSAEARIDLKHWAVQISLAASWIK